LLIILCILLFICIPAGIWLCLCGETFFSITRRLPADILIVEGWIGPEGVCAAAQELSRGCYKYVVATGGEIRDRADGDSSSYAERAKQELIEFGVPESRIIVSPTSEIERQRTFKLAVTAWQSIQRAKVRPGAINIFTLGPHAMRSQLVYEKVFAPQVPVGVIAFTPSEYRIEPWWQSFSRTKCLFKEVVGYPFERWLNSGRISNSPTRSEGLYLASQGRQG
jgi:hypothetical protein